MTQLSVSNAVVEFGATTLFKDITFTVGVGDRWGIVGRNGTGKTTLFKLLTGAMQPTRGQVARQPGLRVSLLEQHRDFGDAKTVWEAAAGQFADLLALEASLAEQAMALGENSSEAALDRYGHDLERFEREGGYTFAPRVDAVLHGLGFDPTEARTRPLERLSGGERGRVGLARQLVSPADVLLLDEPTNHLDLETTRWLEQYLAETDKSVVLISHDRAFLAAVANHILHFEGDSAFAYTGSYESFIVQREERRLAQERQFQKQQRTIAAESDYIARNIAGQNTKQAKGRRKRLERLPRLSAPIGEDGTMALRLDIAERGGDQVVVAKDVTIAVPDAAEPGGQRVLIERFSARLTRGERLGILGPNGAGKSTFLKTLMGEREVIAGELTLGGSIKVAYYRQDLAQVPLDRTLYEVISDLRPTWERRMVQGHLGRFGFSGDEVQRRAESLSGGERARVALAMMMLSRANLLVLDEPTNHLDVESIEALEDAIERYEGTVILVSHDRALLRALATRVWVLHDRHVTDFDGSFAEWEVVSEERAHAASVLASEEEALRRVKEKQKTERRTTNEKASTDRQRAESREARRTLERAEGEVARLEKEVAKLSATLEDPELYTKPDGAKRASSLGAELERTKRALDQALEAWTAAVEKVEVPG
ncbi:MAG TPA: ABC-F family ATP-binding cassette domain-containing protein [Gemmatimonadaceae bacterium]|nr:ABC-F family ATP-binding cassette domain-containing protein [Gemmatimonadaceae bacterium]